jgi:DNA-binding transcriptional ArsR family regulator
MSTATTAEVFAALGDANRQRILELLVARGRASATDLAAPLAVSRQAVTKHLVVLEHAGFVDSRRHGREVLFAMRREGLERPAAWLAEISAGWDRQLAAVKELAEE